MAYSQQTTNYGLPLPTGSDKSNFLDTNQSFQAVDTALHTAVTGLTAVEGSVQNLNSDVTSLETAVTSHGTAITSLQNAISSLQSDKQNKTDNSLDTASKTIVGAINEVNSKLGNLHVDVKRYATVSGGWINLSNTDFQVVLSVGTTTDDTILEGLRLNPSGTGYFVKITHTDGSLYPDGSQFDIVILGV